MTRSALFPLPFQVFNSPIDNGDQFMVPLALGPFRCILSRL
jgi:hypothetical protein